MPDWIGRGSTRVTRRAPLYDCLKTRRPGDVILEGSSLRLANNRSKAQSLNCLTRKSIPPICSLRSVVKGCISFRTVTILNRS